MLIGHLLQRDDMWRVVRDQVANRTHTACHEMIRKPDIVRQQADAHGSTVRHARRTVFFVQFLSQQLQTLRKSACNNDAMYTSHEVYIRSTIGPADVDKNETPKLPRKQFRNIPKNITQNKSPTVKEMT